MSFAENLQLARKKNGLTQEALADYLGVSRQAVSKWEQGEGYPEVEKLLTLSELLGVSIDSLMDRDPSYKAKMEVYSMRYNPKATMMLNRDMLKRDLICWLALSVVVAIILAVRGHLHDESFQILLIIMAVFAAALALFIVITRPKRLVPDALLDAAEEFELVLPDDVTSWVIDDYAPGYRKGSVYICRRGDAGFDEICSALRDLKGARTKIEPDYPRFNLTIYTVNSSETIETFIDNVTYGGKIYRVPKKYLETVLFTPSFARLFRAEQRIDWKN